MRFKHLTVHNENVEKLTLEVSIHINYIKSSLFLLLNLLVIYMLHFFGQWWWTLYVLPPAGQPCEENGASGNQNSSPRGHAVCPVNLPPTTDVVIHRKESEGFGFVIISSLNRPETTTTISRTQHGFVNSFSALTKVHFHMQMCYKYKIRPSMCHGWQCFDTSRFMEDLCYIKALIVVSFQRKNAR